MTRTYKLLLKSEFTEVEKVPPFVERMSGEGQFDTDLRDRVLLALSEAVTNAIVHGNKEHDDKSVTVQVSVDELRVRMTVRDEGEGSDPGDIPDPTAKENLLEEGGRGLFLIEAYADAIDYLDDGRTISMTFTRRRKG